MYVLCAAVSVNMCVYAGVSMFQYTFGSVNSKRDTDRVTECSFADDRASIFISTSVCVYVCILYTYVCVCVFFADDRASIFISTSVCVYVCILYTYVCVCVLCR